MEKSRRSVFESDLSRWQSFRPMQPEGLHGLQESRDGGAAGGETLRVESVRGCWLTSAS